MHTIKKHQAFPRIRGSNVTLIGMPGSGKSTMAKVTAKFMRRRKIDTDNVLCKMTHSSSTGDLLLKTDGKSYLKAEEKAVLSLALNLENHIIATGGSVVYSARGMRHLQKLGAIIYIEVPIDILEKRLGSLEERGVILKPGESFRDLYERRHKLYKRYADMEFRPADLDVGSSAKLLAALIEFMEAEKEKYHA